MGLPSLLVGSADIFGGTRCIACGRSGMRLCPACATGLRPPRDAPSVRGARRVACAWEHEGAARSLVLSLKLRGDRAAAVPMAAAMTRSCRIAFFRAGTVTWVPARRRDIALRGFDHAELLAREVAARLGVGVGVLLHRERPATDQARLGAAQRASNIDGAFGARSVRGHVILVDDVITTGATARACVGVLRAAGASSVDVLTACRVS